MLMMTLTTWASAIRHLLSSFLRAIVVLTWRFYHFCCCAHLYFLFLLSFFVIFCLFIVKLMPAADVVKEPQRILFMLQKGVEYVQETRWRHLFVSFSPLEEELFGSWSFEPVGQSIEGNKDTLITFGFQLLLAWWLKTFSGGFSGFDMLVDHILILSLEIFWESFTNISFFLFILKIRMISLSWK